jgi:hypothetical protein
MDEDALQLPEDLGTLNETELRELHARWVSRIEELRSLETLSVDQAREVRRLVDEANQVAALVNELVTEAPSVADLAAHPAPAPEPTPEPVAEAPESTPEAAAEVVAEAEAAVQEASEPVAASISVNELDLPQGDNAPSERTGPEPAPFLASVGQADYQPYTSLTVDDLGNMFDRAQAERLAPGSQGGKVILASVNRYVDGAPRLGSDKRANTELINDLPQEHDPITAAICGPLDIVRPIPDCVNRSRIIRGLFRQVPAPRGAFQFMRSIGLADVDGGVTIWTDADQATVDEGDPATWKPCVDLVCSPTVETEVEAISTCMRADVKQEFSAPEQVQNWLNTLQALTDRVAEGELLSRIDANSSAYTFAGNYGALPELLQMVAAQLGKSMEVMRATTPEDYVLIIPVGLSSQLVMDTVNRGFHDPCCTDQVMKAFAEIGIRVVETPDAATGELTPYNDVAWPLNPPGAAPVAQPTTPTSWKVRLVAPSAGFYFDTGEVAFGIQRSPELARQNKVQWFGEIFEGLDKQGCAPWFSTTVTLCPNGDRAGMSVPFTC